MIESHVYLVDDNAAFRESTTWLLESAGFSPTAFSSGLDFIEAYEEIRNGSNPECLISDIRMPQMSGLQLQDELNRRGSRLPTLFVTAHGDVPLAVEAMRKGAVNFIEKPFNDKILIDAIHLALNLRSTRAASVQDESYLAKLSPREKQVFDLVVASKPNKIIADILNISIKTVELHRSNMMHKLGVNSIPDLMKVALTHD
jgi:two-component system, LuxR family, response regulator FixJ